MEEVVSLCISCLDVIAVYMVNRKREGSTKHFKAYVFLLVYGY